MEKLYDLIYPQKEIALLEQFYKKNTSNNICGYTIIKNVSDFKILGKTVNIVVKEKYNLCLHLVQHKIKVKQCLSDFQKQDVKIINLKEKIVFSISKNKMKLINNFYAQNKLCVFNFLIIIYSIYISKIINLNNFTIGTPIFILEKLHAKKKYIYLILCFHIKSLNLITDGEFIIRRIK